MMALTVHQPYAHLVVTPQDELPDGAYQKRVENRTWKTNVRGQIAIHAGVSMKWFDGGDWPGVRKGHPQEQYFFPEMAFGAVVGVAHIVECFHINDIECGFIPDDRKWLQTHIHCNGPYCFVLDNVRRLPKPVPAVGKQGFWSLDEITEFRVLQEMDDMDDYEFLPRA
jgi:hypothetical protein